MGITDYKKEDVVVSEDLATKMYKEQLKVISNIAHTDGYKEIKEYWKREKESANTELQTVKEEFLKIVQMRHRIADNFIAFLESRENAKKVQAMTKQKSE